MLGKDIAKNLRENRDMWTMGAFIRTNNSVTGCMCTTCEQARKSPPRPRYCVLGLKAHEAGATDQQILKANFRCGDLELGRDSAITLNDHGRPTVDEVIRRFEAHAEVDFYEVEEFIKAALAVPR